MLSRLIARFRRRHAERPASGKRTSRPFVEELENRLVLSPPGTGWQPLLDENFDGTALNPALWYAATGARRHAVNTASAVSVGGGNLTITTYTSGSTHYTGFVGSYSGFRATYGYWEARIRFQDSPGMWSAFWAQSPTMGSPLGDPATAGTEIDIAEHRSRDAAGADLRNWAAINIHWDGYGAAHQSGGTLVNNPGGTSLQSNFHTYALQWSPSGYQFYLDGVQVWSTSQAISKRSEFIYLTSEVENNSWAGPIPTGGYGSLTTSTTKMTVDWVRVWQRPVSSLPDLATVEDTTTATIPFTVTQQDGRTTTITATSSSTALAPTGNIIRGGSGANRTVRVVPAPDQTGTASITLTASNGVVSGSDSFTVTVHGGSFHNADFEDDPLGTGWSRYGGAQAAASGARSGTRAMRIAGYGGAEQLVTGLSPATTYTLGGYARVSQAGVAARIGVKNYGGAERWATITVATYTRGTVTFTTGPTSTQALLYAFKSTADAEGYFDDLYLFRAPTITDVSDQATGEDTPLGPIAFAIDRVTGPYTVTASSSNTALVPDANLAVSGSGRNWAVTAVPAADRFGTTTITLRATDPHGGSVQDTFVLTVNPVNDAPVLAPLIPQTVPAGQDVLVLPLTATDADGDALTFVAHAESLAYVLDQSLGFFSDGNYHENAAGLGEKWVQGIGGLWYAVLPSGDLYRWDGAEFSLVVTVGASYWAAPVLLHEAQPGQPHAALDPSAGMLTIDREDGFAGSLVVWVLVSDGQAVDVEALVVLVTI